MSAFVVSPQTMTRVVTALLGRSQYDHAVIREFAGLDTGAADAGTKIGQRLFKMNIDAVRQRYPDTVANPEDMPGTYGCAKLAKTYKFTGRAGSRLSLKEWVECHKALHCLQYQCSEGNVPQTAQFKELHAAIGSLADHIVSLLPEYETAGWDD